MTEPRERRIGPYQVLTQLGRGGVGAVFKARAPEGHEVAIKLLLRLEPVAEEKFLREQRLQAELGGEASGFVPLLDQGRAESGLYLVMPLLAGTLRERLQDEPLGLEEVVELARDLAHALARAHAREIVHRDLKPENVLFNWEGRPLLADLGLAKHYGDERSLGFSKTGEMRGTIGYMAPEQMQDAKAVGPAADVFALGAVLYECLAGRPAFAGESFVEVCAAVLESTPEPLTALRPDVPPALSDLVARCLSKDARERPADGETLAALLDGEPRPSRSAHGGWRWALAMALGGLLLAAAIVVRARLTWPAGTPAPAASARPSPSSSTEADDTASSRSPSAPLPLPSGPLPPQTQAFQTGPGVRLLSAWGTYRGKVNGLVNHLAFTPDGEQFVSSSWDGTCKLWDTATGDELRTYARGKPGTIAVAVSPDGARVLAGDAEGGIRLWDRASGELLRSLHTNQGAVWEALFADADRVYLGCEGAVELWDLNQGTLVNGLHVPCRSVYCLALARRRGLFLCGGGAPGQAEPGLLSVWDLRTGAEVASLRHEGALLDVVVSADERQAYAVDDRGWLTAYDLDPAPAERGRWQVAQASDGVPARARALVQTPSRQLVIATETGLLQVWDPLRQLPLAALRGHASFVNALALHPGGRRLVSGGNDVALRLWNLDDGTELWKRPGHLAPPDVLDVSPDGSSAISVCGLTGLLVCWDVASGRERWRAQLTGGGAPVSCDVGDSWVAAADPQRAEVRLFSLSDGHALPSSSAPPGLAGLVAADARKLVTWTPAGAVAVFDVDQRGARPASPARFELGLHVSNALSPGDGTLVLTVREGQKLTSRTLDLSTGALGPSTWLRPADLGPTQRPAVVTRAGGIWLARLDEDRLRFMSARDGSTLAALDLRGVHRKLVSSAVSPDGALGVTSDNEGRIAIWDLQRGELRGQIDLSSSDSFAFSVELSGSSPLQLLVGTSRGVILRFALAR